MDPSIIGKNVHMPDVAPIGEEYMLEELMNTSSTSDSGTSR